MHKKIIYFLTVFILTMIVLSKTVMLYATYIKEETIKQSDIIDNYNKKELGEENLIENNINNGSNIKSEANIQNEISIDTKINTKSDKNAETVINSENINKEEINSNKSDNNKYYHNNGENIVKNLSNDNKAIEDGIYIIKSSINNKYVLDVSCGSKDNGANIQLYSSNDTEAQKFRVKYTNEGYYEIESVRSGKVLDVKNGGKKNGTNIWQYEHNGTDSQKWIIKKNSDDTYSIISKLNDLYVDVLRGRAQDGQNIQVYSGNGTLSQKFFFEKLNSNIETTNNINKKTIEDGIYTIKSSINNKYVLDVSCGSKDNGANIQLYSSNDTEAQKFRVKYTNEGYYEIESVRSGKVLDVKNGGKKNGTNIWQYEHNGTDSQKWIIKKNSDDTYSIISKLNDLYVDVLRGRAQDGQNIQVYSGNETLSQKFIFEKNEAMGSRTIENGTYIIKSAIDENFVLDVSDNSKKDGANIQLYSFNGTDAQKFNIKYINNGYYSIIGKNSNKSLEVKDSSKQAEANVWQIEYKETDAQKWIIKDIGNGYFNIISKCNGLYLDVKGALAKDYTNIQMYGGNKTNAQKFKFLNADNIQYSEGIYGKSGLKIQENSKGSNLKYYKIGSGPNVFFATFAIHGWEDDFNYDGQELTKIAEKFKNKLISMQDIELMKKWTIYILPSLNPDGEYHGWTHDGPGRTTLYSDAPGHKGIDMNRTWSTDWVKYTTDRNYTGTEPFQAYEARYLRDFLLSHKSINGQTVLVDLHGWLNETMGDEGISSYYHSQLGMNKHISSYGRGYLINWARSNLGANGRTARSALIELPEAYSSADVLNWGLADKYINATINMLRGI